MDEPAPPTALAQLLERAQALSALLPAALLAWSGPGAPLDLDPYPALSGAGWVLLASLPCGLLVLLRGAWRASHALLAYPAFLLLGLLLASRAQPTDSLEAARANLLGLATLFTLLGGAGLGSTGRRWLACGLAALAALTLLPAVVFSGERGSGAFGNAATTSDVALGGLLAACVGLTAERRGVRLTSALLLGLGVLHAARAPVLTTLAILGAALVALRIARAAQPRRNLWLAALAAVLLAGAGFRWSTPAGAPPQEPPARPIAAASDMGGLAVRAHLARASLDMLAAHPLTGVGRGQFTAAFPPWRDPAEIALSTFDHTLVGRTTEVEHPHDDWLLGALETGLAGGILWWIFLLACARAAWRALRDGELALAALGAAGLAWLAAAALRGTLLCEPASASAAFAALGACLGARAEAPRRALVRLLVNVSLLVGFVSIPRALALVRHGRALAELGRSDVEPWPAVQRALDACPDSTVARAWQARLAPGEAVARGAAAAPDVVPLWRSVLALRPHHFEAWMEVGNAFARGRQLDPAREAYLRALELDGDSPPLLQNLATLEINAGRADAAEPYLDRLERERRLPAGWLEDAAMASASALRPEIALRLLARARPGWGDPAPQALWERAQSLPPEQADLAAVLTGLAHLAWAREQIAAGDPDAAVISYRQALRGLAGRPGSESPGELAPVLRLEFAAALLRAGKADSAAEEALRAQATPRDLARLPTWAGDELLAAGLIGR